MPSFFTTPAVLLGISLFASTGSALAAETHDALPTTSTAPMAVFQDLSDASDGGLGGHFVFAASLYQPDDASNSTADLYIHLSAPSAHQWMAVGVGDSMDTTLMWIAYPNQNKTGTTLSTRLALGHQEPLHDAAENWGCEQIGDGTLAIGSSSLGGMMTLDAVCRGVANWNGTHAVAPTLQDTVNNTFVYALGPYAGYGNHGGNRLLSDDPAAELNMHSYHGRFTMQLQNARTNDSSVAGNLVPNDEHGGSTPWVAAFASDPIAAKKDGRDFVPVVHGVVMCLAFLLVFPSGALVLRFAERVLVHAVVQSLGFVLVCAGVIAGAVVSVKYRWSVHLLSAHQIIGILIVVALAVQLGLGIAHHRVYAKKQVQRPTIMGRVHKFLGPAAISGGVVNAPLGLYLAGNNRACWAYISVLIIAAVVLGLLWYFWWRERRPQGKGNPMQMRVPRTTSTDSQRYDYAPAGSGGQGQDKKSYGGLLGGGRLPDGRRRVSYKSDDVSLGPYEESRVNTTTQQQQPAHPRSMV